MIQKKWFRVEHDKDGNILSCEEVDAKGRAGSVVRFYEAANKADACSQAKAWWERRLQQNREYQRQRRQNNARTGRCQDHGCALPCARCAKKRADYRERAKLGIQLKPQHREAEDALAAKREAGTRYRRWLIDIRLVAEKHAALSAESFARWLRKEQEARRTGNGVTRRRPGVRAPVPAAEAAE